MPKAQGEKVDAILRGAIAVMAEKGYEKATIKEIADAAGVSRGLLHYYFENKEDLMTRALEVSSSTLAQSARAMLSAGNSPEELVDGGVEYLRRNFEENPSFYRLLFEMWCASVGSEKIRKGLVDCSDQIIEAIDEELKGAYSRGAIGISASESEGLARLLLAIIDGLAFQLIPNREKLKDEKIWKIARDALILILGGDRG